MGRSPCCDKVGLKKGPWTPEEDQKLLAYIEEHGHGSWRALPAKVGLQRCGKSCRLRWTNYLRPDIKRGKFSLQEEQTIIQLHALLGNRWSAIATHLPNRTDNEIKNYWNTHLKKRLAKMGIDPVTHKPKNDLLSNDGAQTKNAASLSHMAQWESARLEAEARLVRESKLRISHTNNNNSLPLLGLSPKTDVTSSSSSKSSECVWSHVALSKSTPVIESPRTVIEFVGSSTTVSASASNSEAGAAVKEEGGEEQHDWKGYHRDQEGIDQNSLSFSATWTSNSNNNSKDDNNMGLGFDVNVAEEDDQLGFTSLLLNNSDDRSLSDGGDRGGGDSENGRSGSHDEQYHDNENYWNSILNLVNSSPSDSPMF